MIQEAKEKAEELVSKFSSKLPFYSEKDNLSKAKQCALICVDDEIKLLIKIQTEHHSDNYFTLENEIQKLIEVKQQIELLKQ